MVTSGPRATYIRSSAYRPTCLDCTIFGIGPRKKKKARNVPDTDKWGYLSKKHSVLNSACFIVMNTSGRGRCILVRVIGNSNRSPLQLLLLKNVIDYGC